MFSLSILLLVVGTIGSFVYLYWRVGWKEAVAATVLLFGMLWAAFVAFFTTAPAPPAGLP